MIDENRGHELEREQGEFGGREGRGNDVIILISNIKEIKNPQRIVV